MIKESNQLSFDKVGKSYGREKAVIEAFDLTVSQGEFVSLIGPSGCGKSTILKLIAGLTSITEGELKVDSESPENAREAMAYIFQEATLLPWLTVTYNIQVPLRLLHWSKSKREEVANRLIELAGLSSVKDYYPRQLSGGMQMRVSIARALTLSPKILLLDEPFGALDEMARDHLNEELLAIRAQEDWTALFVTHSVPEAVFLSSRIIILSANPGRLYKTIPIDFPYPRKPELRESLEYQQVVADVSHHLRSVER
jgi:NitT/TauT family transport system ATP-binding protein